MIGQTRKPVKRSDEDVGGIPGRRGTRRIGLQRRSVRSRDGCTCAAGRWWAPVMCWAAVVWCSAASPAGGQSGDTFEAGRPRWLLVESDCNARLTEQAISPIFPHSGQACELLQVACDYGTSALVAYPIEPALVVDDFRPFLWTRCASSHLKLGVRVVFPYARHPVTAAQLTTILWGDQYESPGRWQKLQVRDLERGFNQASALLRQRHGSDLNLEGAYIDCLVLNLYTGPGRYRVQVDDLELRGVVPLSAVVASAGENWRQRWRWRYDPPPPVTSQWESSNRPPVWLQHRGEPLPWIASLGINGIVTDQLATPLLDAVQTLDLAVIVPPPADPSLVDEEVAAHIRGWLVGAALDRSQFELAAHQVARNAEYPEYLKKPVFAEALEDIFRYARVVDNLVIPAPGPYSSGNPQEKQAWLVGRMRSASGGGGAWVSLVVDPPPALCEQLVHAAQRVAPDFPVEESLVAPMQLRREIVGAVQAGARGIWLRTTRPLQAHEPADNLRASVLRWSTNDLTLWGPWVMAGNPLPPPEIDSPYWTAAAWALENSQLVVLQPHRPAEWFGQTDPAERELNLGWAAALPNRHVLRLSWGSVQRMSVQWERGQARWTVEDPAPVETFVIASDDRVLRFIEKHLRETAAESAADMLESAAVDLSMAARLVAAQSDVEMRGTTIGGRPGANPAASQAVVAVGEIQTIEMLLEQARRALRSGSVADAMRLGLAADTRAQTIMYRARRNALEQLPSPQSSPFVLHPA
ncbi:MAG: hypothetical protein D6753_04270, partial [Planctomycetota bacterium]